MTEKLLYNKIFEQNERISDLTTEYWHLYSSFDTWYFWFNLATMLIPLIILFIAIDRSRLFEISFFGYTVHVLWANGDTILASNNFLVHPHTLTPLLPVGITVTDVLIPVIFMLVYQYCTNKKRNFYIYAIITSIIIAFGFGYFSLVVDLLRFHKGMNLIYLFIIDVGVVFVAFWITKLFIKMKYMKKKS